MHVLLYILLHFTTVAETLKLLPCRKILAVSSGDWTQYQSQDHISHTCMYIQRTNHRHMIYGTNTYSFITTSMWYGRSIVPEVLATRNRADNVILACALRREWKGTVIIECMCTSNRVTMRFPQRMVETELLSTFADRCGRFIWHISVSQAMHRSLDNIFSGYIFTLLILEVDCQSLEMLGLSQVLLYAKDNILVREFERKS